VRRHNRNLDVPKAEANWCFLVQAAGVKVVALREVPVVPADPVDRERVQEVLVLRQPSAVSRRSQGKRLRQTSRRRVSMRPAWM